MNFWQIRILPVTLLGALLSGCGSDSSNSSPAEPSRLEPNQRYDLLYRATFGPTPNSYQQMASVGYQSWLDQQFSMPPSFHLPLLQSYVIEGDTPTQSDRVAVWWHQANHAPDQLRQRVAFALSEIFVVSRYGASLNGRAQELTHYYDMLLEHAFGNYRDLLEAVTRHPVMGDYLSMMANQHADPQKNRFPDENYAREVMQLFSIGLYQLNQDGTPLLNNGALLPTYSQDDIENLARVFTGWHLADKSNGSWTSKQGDWFQAMAPYADKHDSDEKFVMGERFPAGQSIEQDMAQAMAMLTNHPNTGPFIARLLIQRLVTSNPSPQYVERVALAFNDNGNGIRGDLKAVIQAILLDPEALNGPTERLKEPLISVANLYRALEAKSADPTGRYHNSNGTFFAFGQAPLSSPSVFNFFSPDYAPNAQMKEKGLVAPEFQILSWNNFINISNQMWSATGNSQYDSEENPKKIVVNLAPLEALANDHPALIAELSRRFLSEQISPELALIIEQNLNQLKEHQQNTKVRNALHIILNSQEFHTEVSNAW
ncbi:DUF1800 domain-containing protein [Vibrio vulnificus]|uniref:DUF1800 domain-containing protein n=1 Tax=Vibrio vulnificus TaxID=672 RepID=UPI00163BF545|nr:DUF1800 domain-containing protein [Vibrio vulnificus]QNE00787.1 DUF1800 domain-containing protein [Vibrio vulnificus]